MLVVIEDYEGVFDAVSLIYIYRTLNEWFH